VIEKKVEKVEGGCPHKEKSRWRSFMVMDPCFDQNDGYEIYMQ
jgi:hypothetical protein